MAPVLEGTGWLTARSERLDLNSAVRQPRLRVLGPTLQAQHSLIERAYPVVLLGWSAVALLTWARSDRMFYVFSAVAALLGALLMWRMLRVWTVIDASGWHEPNGVIPRPTIEEIVLFRGSGQPADFIRTSDGRRTPLTSLLPKPLTGRGPAPLEAVDLLCRLQHDLSHELGWEPVPVRVDVGHGVPMSSFRHDCIRCGSIGASDP